MDEVASLEKEINEVLSRLQAAHEEIESLRRQLAAKDALIERMPAWTEAHARWLRERPNINHLDKYAMPIRERADECEKLADRFRKMISGEWK